MGGLDARDAAGRGTQRVRMTIAAGALALLGASVAGQPLGAAPPNAPPNAPVRADAGWQAPGAANPLLPGYFADPSIVRDGDTWYIFATKDPWGGDTLSLWTSANGRDWRFSEPAWPTKQAATSPTSGDAKVWAPSVVKARNGRWYMYVSVGSEIWVGSAPSPAGPWADANGGKPLVARDFAPEYHMIDAEAFIDDDGQAYLYWGSGLNWTNGHCFVVKLKPDMIGFDGTPRDVTPPRYFEAPFMVKAGGRYLLTYSDGNTTTDTYQVRYAVGDSPLGPFREGAGNPVLATDRARDVISPGHHAVFGTGADRYILYGRQSLPWPRKEDGVFRQVAVDPLRIGADGRIAKVVPSHGSRVAGFAAARDRGLAWKPVGTDAAARYAADDNYATLWKPAGTGAQALVADLGAVRNLRSTSIRPEFPDKVYVASIETSTDGRTWRPAVAATARMGSPIDFPLTGQARFLRLNFPQGRGAVWEWTIR